MAARCISQHPHKPWKIVEPIARWWPFACGTTAGPGTTRTNSMSWRCVDEFGRDGIAFFDAHLCPDAGSPGCGPGRAQTASEDVDIDFGWRLAGDGRWSGPKCRRQGRARPGRGVDRGHRPAHHRDGEFDGRAGSSWSGRQAQAGHAIRRADIGCSDIENDASAGGRVLAIEAGRTITSATSGHRGLADRYGMTSWPCSTGGEPSPYVSGGEGRGEGVRIALQHHVRERHALPSPDALPGVPGKRGEEANKCWRPRCVFISPSIARALRKVATRQVTTALLLWGP